MESAREGSRKARDKEGGKLVIIIVKQKKNVITLFIYIFFLNLQSLAGVIKIGVSLHGIKMFTSNVWFM